MSLRTTHRRWPEHSRSAQLLPIAALLASIGCGGTDNQDSQQSQGGSAQLGGRAGTGGASSASNAGGSRSPEVGGAESSGGKSATGGSSEARTGGSSAKESSSTGGAKSTGGTSATGGVAPSTGGAKSTASSNSSGGSATGGSSASPGTGGTPATGGSRTTGGAASAGGQAALGGSAATGGTLATTSSGGTSSSGGTTSTGSSSGKPTFHVFLLLGQSNMAGYPKAQDADKVKNTRIQVLGFDNCTATGRQTDKWDVAVPPLHECWNGALGPGDWFSKTIIANIPEGDTIGLVPCAISGEKIETFMKAGGSKYTWITQRAKLAQQAGGVIEGILFHQGESNCGDSSWPGKVNTLITDLRTDLGIGNVPFLAGELPPAGNCSQHNTQVAKLPTVMTNAYVVSAQGLNVDPADTQWHLHFDHDSQVTFGKRYAQAMISALKW